MLNFSSPVQPERAKRVEGLIVVAFVAAFAAACGAKNPNFCEGPACEEVDASIDAAPVTCTATGGDPTCPATTPVCEDGECTGMCTSDTDCDGRAASEAVCLSSSGACVQCDETNTQATPGQPEDECPAPALAVCDGDTHTCRACEAHSECFSGVCDAGTCVAQANIIYMSANGTDGGGNTCNNSAPGMGCLTMHHAKGQLTTARKYIKMEPSGTPYDTRNNDDLVEFNGVTQSAHIIGTGATLRRLGGNPDGLIVEVKSGAVVTIEGLTITSATGPTGDGILCSSASTLDLRRVTITANAQLGVNASNCALRVSRSTISNNDAGGIRLTNGAASSFNIVNNFVVGNGDVTSSDFGGLSLASGLTTNSLEFNTVVLNTSQVGTPDGITCTNAGLVARNNIVIGLATKPRVNPGTNCTHRYTLFTPDNGVTDEGNMTILDQGMYMFESATNFHIRTGSVAAAKAQSSGLTGESLFDVDGDARALGSATLDVGADEIP